MRNLEFHLISELYFRSLTHFTGHILLSGDGLINMDFSSLVN